MSEDFAGCTPPVTPPLSEDGDKFEESFSLDGDVWEGIFQKRCCSFRWFNCLGEARQEIKLHEESYLMRGEEDLFNVCDEIKDLRWKREEKRLVNLFGHDFDKGAALLLDAETLCKFARCDFMTMETVSAPLSFGARANMSAPQRKDITESRRRIVQFFLYIREYLFHISSLSSRDFKIIFNHLRRTLGSNMRSFRRLMKRLTDLPEYICNHAANSQGNKTTQPAYQIFHCHLDVRWLHLTTVAVMSDIVLSADRDEIIELGFDESQYSLGLGAVQGNDCAVRGMVGQNVVESTIDLLVSDLVQLAVLRFEKLGLKDLSKHCAFNCTCVRELWILLQLLVGHRERKNTGSKSSFWSVVNKVLIKVSLSTSTGGGDASNSEPANNISLLLNLPENYSCSNPLIFNVWLIKSLAYLFTYNDREMMSNYELIEKIIKEQFKTDVPESLLRILIPILHCLIVDLWEPRNEPVIILWEYYQKRLNNTFYVPGTTLENMAVASKTPLGLISQVDARLNGDKQPDSFQQFLQFFGLYLKRTEDNPKYWNQLKGRIYSKFPASKMAALTENGLYHFVSLFLTIAMARNEISEICKKLQEFLGFVDKEDVLRVKLVWQTHLAVLLLHAERQLDLTQPSLLLMKSVCSLDLSRSENSQLMRTFVEGFQEIIDRSTSLNLGQSNLIGDWISRYLSVCGELEMSVLLSSLLSIVTRIKGIVHRPLEMQELEIFEKLWLQVKQYIANNDAKMSEGPLLHLADVTAGLAILSIRISHTALRFREMVSVFCSKEIIDTATLCRFLCCLTEYKPLAMALPDHNTFIMKSWIRCEVLSLDTHSPELMALTRYVTSLTDFKRLEITSELGSEPVVRFFGALQNRYNGMQDLNEKGRMRDAVCRYFEGMKQWLQHVIKAPDNLELVRRVYTIIGHMVSNVGALIYVKSQTSTVLQSLIDLLLLPPTVRRPDHQLNCALQAAIKSSLHLYVEGLVKLGVESDKYIGRIAQELIIVYLPRCVALPGQLEATNVKAFSLVHCFRSFDQGGRQDGNEMAMKFVLEMIKANFLKARVRTPQVVCRQSIKFLRDVLSANGYGRAVLISMLRHMLVNVCGIILYCEERNPCRREAMDLMLAVLDSNPVREDSTVGDEVMKVFSRLCQEHLAFSSRQLFSLFNLLCSSGPDLIYRFLPILTKHIKEVENKRGVGYDRAMRAELENLEKTLNLIKK